MNKKLLIPSLLLLTALPVAAQKLTAEKTTVDVGRTGYEHPITAVFEFKTKGKVRVEDVRPDCQCTKVEFPKGAVGDRFQIRMTYDARQLGHFNQQAAVLTNTSPKPLYITMTGVVLEHYVDLSGNYPVEMGDLRLNTNVTWSSTMPTRVTSWCRNCSFIIMVSGCIILISCTCRPIFRQRRYQKRCSPDRKAKLSFS